MAKDPQGAVSHRRPNYTMVSRACATRVAGRRSAESTRRRRRLVVGLARSPACALRAWLCGRWSAARRLPRRCPRQSRSLRRNDSTGQPDLDELAALLQSVLSRNLAALPGHDCDGAGAISASGIDPRDQPAPAPGYIVAVTIRRAVSGIAADVALIRKGDANPCGTTTFEGDALGVLRSDHGESRERARTPLRGRPDHHRVRTALGCEVADARTREALYVVPEGPDRARQSEAARDRPRPRPTCSKAPIKRDEIVRVRACRPESGVFVTVQAHREPLAGRRDERGQSRAGDRSRAPIRRYLASALALQCGTQEERRRAGSETRPWRLTPDSDDAPPRSRPRAHRPRTTARRGVGRSCSVAVALRPSHWMKYYSLGRSLLVTANRSGGDRCRSNGEGPPAETSKPPT